MGKEPTQLALGRDGVLPLPQYAPSIRKLLRIVSSSSNAGRMGNTIRFLTKTRQLFQYSLYGHLVWLYIEIIDLRVNWFVSVIRELRYGGWDLSSIS